MEGMVSFPSLLQATDLLINFRNPLGCAVAMTALSVLIDERLADRAMRLGEYFRSSIRALNSPLVKEVRGRGLLNAVVIDEDLSKKRGKGRTAWQFCLLLKSRGVLAKPTHVNMYVLIFTVISDCSLRWFPASASLLLSS
jgi:acetylornithine/succinyldiaminopimelate/putrescine aminotransferase